MTDIEHQDLEAIGQLYLAEVMEKWEEAYSLYKELEYAGKREFIQGGKPESSMEVYDNMMQAVADALLTDPQYDLSVEETTNAFIYSANNDIDLDEFRIMSSEIVKGEKMWLDYCQSSF